MAESFEVSSLHVVALNKALAEHAVREHLDRFFAPETVAALDSPYSHLWHSGSIAEDIWVTTQRHLGSRALSDVNYTLSKKTFGPVVMPMVKVALALSGGGPASIAGRMDTVMQLAVRKLTVNWTKATDKSGEFVVTYGRRVAPEAEHAWRGVFRFMFELGHSHGRVDHCDIHPDGHRFAFALAWSPGLEAKPSANAGANPPAPKS